MRRIVHIIVLWAATFAAGSIAPTHLHAQDVVEAVRGAERAFVAAIRANSRRAMGRSLAAKFTFVDAAGVTRVKSAIMDDIALAKGSGENETQLAIRPYGQIALVSGERGNVRFMRVWAKRRVGWLLFAMIETPIGGQASPASPAPSRGDGVCENPCLAMPYRPLTAQDAQIATRFRMVETAKWRGNADELMRSLAPEFAVVAPGGVTSRDKLVTEIRTAGRPGVPGDPVMVMRIHGFDGSAIMATRQRPDRGGKPYAAVRVWALRDGRYILVAEQRSAIEAAAAMPAVVKR